MLYTNDRKIGKLVCLIMRSKKVMDIATKLVQCLSSAALLMKGSLGYLDKFQEVYVHRPETASAS